VLYRDYLRPDGEWLANDHGGRENTEAVLFLQQANHVLFEHFPGPSRSPRNPPPGRW
jgi:1,4-alpha-glucan branching enzyme